MRNKILGILIMVIYFANFHICKVFYEGDIKLFWDLKVSIYSILIIITITYKIQNNFIEKLFIAIVLNNICVLLINKEISYSMNDVFFITTFTVLQYVKHYLRVPNNKYIRCFVNFFTIEKEKEK